MNPQPGIGKTARTLSLGLFALLLVGLVLHFAVYLRYAIAETQYPFEIFDAEGIVWQQVLLIPGPRMYGDITRFPFVVFHYPPLVHLIVRTVAALDISPLSAGRGLSVLSTLVLAATIGSLAWQAMQREVGRLPGLAGGLAAGLIFLCFSPVVAVSPLMRVDMLATALSFLGLRLALGSMRPAPRLYGAMALFVASAFTKQTSIIAAVAVLAVLVRIRPGLAVRVFGFGLVLGLVPLGVLSWMTGGGFLRHLVFYNMNRFSLELLFVQLTEQASQVIFVALAAAALSLFWKQLAARRGGISRAALSSDPLLQSMAVLSVYLVLSTCTLINLGKYGGGLNYFVEWMAILSVLLGMLVASAVDQAVAKAPRPLPGYTSVTSLLLPVLLLIQVGASPASLEFRPADPEAPAQLEGLVQRIKAASKPVLSDDMVLLMMAGKDVPMEPAIFSELTHTGQWDERHILEMIARRDFAFVITRGYSLFTPAMVRAIDAAYPATSEVAEHTLHLPAGE